MAINKKLIYYNRTLDQLKSDANGLNNQTTKDANGNVGNIPYTSIVFTNDGYFWTHGKVFNCNNTSAVTSVNGKTGAVTLDLDDIPDGSTRKLSDYLKLEDSWTIVHNPTSVVFSGGNWVDSGVDFESVSAMKTGTYLLYIEDSGIVYSGVFSYYRGTITTDEEILLHACGTKHTYNSGPDGIMYAKIKKKSNNYPALYLAYNQNITNTTLSIKIKKLASI